MTEPASRARDVMHFRSVLGTFPTGVVVVTAMGAEGNPAGMTVGSFTSVSLDPPLVAFLPHAESASWQRIKATGSFCVNVLTHSQEHICRAMASKSTGKFDQVSWRPAESGAPIVDGVAAWIDCDIEQVHRAGDHDIVVGRVRDLDVDSEILPLLFYQGGYGKFSASTLAINDADVLDQLVVVDIARPRMAALADRFNVECVAIAHVEHDVVVVASAGSDRNQRRRTRVGTRAPFVPPAGNVFAAWAAPEVAAGWLRQHRYVDTDLDDRQRKLRNVRSRGFSLGVSGPAHQEFDAALAVRSTGDASSSSEGLDRLVAALADDYEPEDLRGADFHRIRTITAPIFDKDCGVVLALVLLGFDHASTGSSVEDATRMLLSEATAITSAIGGARPGEAAD